MPPRRPLVLINGVQYQVGGLDLLDAAILATAIELVNQSPIVQPICTPVLMSITGFQPARANAIATAEAIGLLKSPSTNPSNSGVIVTLGLFTATAPQWQAVTSNPSGLVPGTVYYLSSAGSGRLTPTAPTAAGEFLVRIGRAVSNISMLLNPSFPIGL
jgi:hypothetical protein